MGHVRDQWTLPPPSGRGKRVRGPRWGKGKRWLAAWTEGGVVRSKAFATQDAATKWVAERDAGVPVRRASTVTVASLMASWQAAQLHHRASTTTSVTSAADGMILPTLGDLTLGELDRQVLQDAVGEWSKRWSASRVRVAWSYVTSALKQAEADGLIDSRPKGIRLPRIEDDPVVPMTAEQVTAIINAFPPWRRSMAIVATGTGMRSGELRGLTWDRLQGDQVIVDRQLVGVAGREPVWGPPKTPSSRRRIKVGASVLAVLEQHRKDWGRDGLVWWTRQGQPVSRSSASMSWRNAADGLGLRERSGWHDLRHHHASLLIAAGMSPTAVAHRLGHKDATETLRTYSHLWPDDEDRMVGVIEAAIEPVARL